LGPFCENSGVDCGELRRWGEAKGGENDVKDIRNTKVHGHLEPRSKGQSLQEVRGSGLRHEAVRRDAKPSVRDARAPPNISDIHVQVVDFPRIAPEKQTQGGKIMITMKIGRGEV
jgi:hypothetical protein